MRGEGDFPPATICIIAAQVIISRRLMAVPAVYALGKECLVFVILYSEGVMVGRSVSLESVSALREKVSIEEGMFLRP